MIRQDFARIDPKRRQNIDYKKRQFATAEFRTLEYPSRLNLYEIPPTTEITLEQFEQWAIDRLRILVELENCLFRNKNPQETSAHITPLLLKYLPLSSSSSNSANLHAERQKDHYSHFILRLSFSSTAVLRARFARMETLLFKIRWASDDARERAQFVQSLNLDWEAVGEEEKREYASELIAATSGSRNIDDESFFKVDWERVPDLVEQRKVWLKRGKAYVPTREQGAMVFAEFTAKLEKSLELTARALPRLDEDDRLAPILSHLSNNFSAPATSADDEYIPGAQITAGSIDTLSSSFPLCMRNLHMQLRKNNHLKHFGRLQYTLFLKGIGLTMEDCITFWRGGFKNLTDDQFNKEYRYNIRHAYGDVGGDVNRRGRGYSPFSCQKILTEHAPGVGEAHGCPYRHFSVENLTALLQNTGVTDRDLTRTIQTDVQQKRFHIACNRVFEHAHKRELKRVKEVGNAEAGVPDGFDVNETIVHPNTWFKRSWLLKNLGKGVNLGAGESAETVERLGVKPEGGDLEIRDVKMEEAEG